MSHASSSSSSLTKKKKKKVEEAVLKSRCGNPHWIYFVNVDAIRRYREQYATTTASSIPCTREPLTANDEKKTWDMVSLHS
jgi:hypothetical protein